MKSAPRDTPYKSKVFLSRVHRLSQFHSSFSACYRKGRNSEKKRKKNHSSPMYLLIQLDLQEVKFSKSNLTNIKNPHFPREIK